MPVWLRCVLVYVQWHARRSAVAPQKGGPKVPRLKTQERHATEKPGLLGHRDRVRGQHVEPETRVAVRGESGVVVVLCQKTTCLEVGDDLGCVSKHPSQHVLPLLRCEAIGPPSGDQL